MPIASARYVICSRCGDPAEIVFGDAKTARQVARLQGFICNRSGDWCGRCWPGVDEGWVFDFWAEPNGTDRQELLVGSVGEMPSNPSDGDRCWVRTRWGVAWFGWSEFDREDLRQFVEHA